VRLVSDRQPPRLRVDRHKTGSPAIWLHRDGTEIAWIIVDIGERDWSKLAYQFGAQTGRVSSPQALPYRGCGTLRGSVAAGPGSKKSSA
jgi:hypothetical protein